MTRVEGATGETTVLADDISLASSLHVYPAWTPNSVALAPSGNIYLTSPGDGNVWRILAATATKHEMHIRRAGGIENHVHVLVELPKTMTVSEALKRLKGGSSTAINNAGLIKSKFGWQDGYAAFTVSPSKVSQVTKYISNQREHHKTQTFEEEFEIFLKKHGVAYDPKYLFG